MKKLTKKSTLYTALILVILTLTLLFSFFRNLKQEELNRHLAVDYLRKTTELEHNLREQILEAHSFLNDSYDSIVETTNQTKLICTELTSPDGLALFSEGDKFSDSIHLYCNLSEESLSATERFKSKNSILVNSLKYFPTLIDMFSNPQNRLNALELYSEILQFCLQPKSEQAFEMKKQLTSFTEKKRGGRDAQLLKSFKKHAALVIQTATERQELEKKLYSPAVKMAIKNLADAYILSTDRRENRSQYFKTAVIVFAAGLMVLLVVLLYRLQLGAETLVELNTKLEAKVAIRTKDLSKALSDLEMQQQILAHSTKMSALGEMAGGIAHEINTPLAAISLRAEALIFTEELSEGMTKGLEEIISIVERVAKIVTGLRRFSRDEHHEAATTHSVAEIVDDTLSLCAQKFKNNGVQLKIHIDPTLLITCLPEQISQVLLNLLNNAYDAVLSLPEKWVSIEASSNLSCICIRITDSGAGIPKELQDKIMQPFFTTKGVGKGTGIGLSISTGIIERQGGKFIYDAQSPNTTFEIRLPEANLSQPGIVPKAS